MSGSVLHTAIAPQRRTKVAGFALNVASIPHAVDLAIDHAAQGKGFTFHTLNLDHVAKLRGSAAFRNSYRRATFVCADGARSGGSLAEGRAYWNEAEIAT